MLRFFRRRLVTARMDIPSEKSLVSADFGYVMVEGYTSSDDWKTNMHHRPPKMQVSKFQTPGLDRQIPRAAVGSIIGVEPWSCTVDQLLQVDMVESGPVVGLGSSTRCLPIFQATQNQHALAQEDSVHGQPLIW